MIIFLYFLNIALIMLFLTGLFLYDYELLNVKYLKFLGLLIIGICILSLFLYNNLTYVPYMPILNGIVLFYATIIFAFIIMKAGKANAIFQTILYVLVCYLSLIFSKYEIMFLILTYILLSIIFQWLTNIYYLFEKKKILKNNIDNIQYDFNLKISDMFSNLYLTYIPIVIIIVIFFTIY